MRSTGRQNLGLVLSILILSGVLAIGLASRVMAENDGVIAGLYIVVLTEGASPEEVARSHGIVPTFVYRFALNGFAGPIAPEKLRDVESDPRVQSVENERRVHAFQTLPTGINRIDADLNSLAKIDGADERVNIDIAIIDTGIDLGHPDLWVVASTNCAQGSALIAWCTDGNGGDGNGHGMHVAGIAAALDNGIGVVGVAPGARLWAVRVLGNDGSGYLSWVIAGVDWVTAHAASIEIANMSLGCECTSSALNTAITNSVAAGVTYVVAAGNSAKNASTFSPANHPAVITVSAIVDTDGRCGGLGASTAYGNDDRFASFSNFGSVVELAAPGVNIYATWKGGTYATKSGTSMASPHVAGAAALYKVANPSATPAQVRTGLITGGVAQAQACDTSLNNGFGGFSGDPDTSAEPLAYVGNPAASPPLSISGLSANANPFSPNGDSSKDTTTISATLSQAASWSLTIKDAGGVVVRDLAAGTGTSVSGMWDGKNNAASVVPDGAYTAALAASTSDSTATSSVAVTVDTLAPTITSGPSAGSITSSGATITWGTNEASDSVVFYRPAGGSTWSAASAATLVTAHSLALSALSAATTYESYVRSTDAAANQVASATQTFTTSSSSVLSVSVSFSHTKKGTSGGANLYIRATVTGSGGQPVGVALNLYQSNDGVNWVLVGIGSTSIIGDGTATFKYSAASCGKYYKAEAVASTTTSVAIGVGTYRITCS